MTYKNRDVFISVVAWMFILYGVYVGYTSLGQLILTVSFFLSPEIPVYLLTILAVGLLFSAVSLWCGLGLRKRSRSALKTLIVFLWLYIVWSVGENIWTYVDHFFVSPPHMESIKQRSGYFLANIVFMSTITVMKCVAIIWLLGKLLSPFIQDEFEA